MAGSIASEPINQAAVRKMQAGINIRQIFIGLNILILGVLYYCYFRTPEHTYFLRFFENTPNLKHNLPPMLAALADSLPTFIHVFAFTLITAGFFASGKKGYIVVCLFWFAVDTLFELGQAFGNTVISIIPGWFSNILLLENTKSYFLHGRFDYLDLVSIAAGSALAYLLLTRTRNPARRPYEKESLSNF